MPKMIFKAVEMLPNATPKMIPLFATEFDEAGYIIMGKPFLAPLYDSARLYCFDLLLDYSGVRFLAAVKVKHG